MSKPDDLMFFGRDPHVPFHGINIFHSEEDEAYIADIPDLEFCSAVGRTPAEALAELQRARSAWIDAAKAAGKPIPTPKYRPDIYQTPS